MRYEKYDDYSDSGLVWLGVMPSHWAVVQSRRLFEQRKERAREDDEQLTASQKYGIVSQKKFMEMENQRVVQVISGSEILKHIEPNDFVISMRSFQGGLEWCKQPGCVSSAYVGLIPIKHVVPEFFAYLFKCAPYIQALQSTSNLVRDGQALRFENFSQVWLPIIPDDEQQKIANFLDHETAKIDTLIAKQQQLIALLKEKRQAVISHAVTKGINPNAPMRDSGVEWLGEVPAHWSAKQLKFLCGYNTEALDDSINDQYLIEYVDISSVSATEGILKTESMVFGEAPSRARRIVRDGDVIISTVRTYLEAIAPIDNPPCNLIVSTGFAVIRPNNQFYKGYAAYCLRANGFIKEVVAQSVGISYPAINASDLVNIKVPVPTYQEQEEIANFLKEETAKIYLLIEKQQQAIALMQERRTALISAAVTGKIDVRDWQAPENLNNAKNNN